MEQYRKWQLYQKQILSGQQLPQNALCYDLQKYSKFFYVWYNVEDFKKLGVRDRVIHLSLMLLVGIHWGLIAVKVSQLPLVLENIGFICKLGSMVLGGCCSVVRCVEGFRKRERVTRLVENIDKKVKVARTSADKENLGKSLYLYICLAWAIIMANFSLAIMVGMILIYTFYSGEFEFEVNLGYEVNTFGPTWWVEVAINQLVMVYCSLLYTIYEGIFMDILLNLTFLHRVQYDRLKTCSGSETEVNRTLVSVYCELKELKLIVAEYLDIVWLYSFSFWSVGYLILASASIGVLIEMEKGFFVLLNFVAYPLFTVSLLGIAAFVGTYFEDAARDYNAELFNFDWSSLTKCNRQLLVNMMTFGQDTARLEVKPFFTINREYFAQVLQKTYTFYTLMREFLQKV